MSETCPPTGMSMGTTVPKVAARAAVEHRTAEHRTAARLTMPGARPIPDNRVRDSAVLVIQSLSGWLTQISLSRGKVFARRRASTAAGQFPNSKINLFGLFAAAHYDQAKKSQCQNRANDANH